MPVKIPCSTLSMDASRLPLVLRQCPSPFRRSRLERAILALDQHPDRCPVAPESVDPDNPVRVLSYGRRPHLYRIFFTVDHSAKVVPVVHVRRGARQRPTAEELKGE